MSKHLVDYSDSDGSDAPESPPKKLVKRNSVSTTSPSQTSALPPLPSKFLDLYTSAPRLSTNDDPAAHGGRVRATPHTEGLWPTHVFLECKFAPSPNQIIHTCSICITSRREKTKEQYLGNGVIS